MAEETSSNEAWITVACSAAILAVVATSYHCLTPNRGRNWIYHAVFAVVAGSIIYFVSPTPYAKYVFSGLTVTLIGALLPIYESIRAVCTPEEDDDKEWLQYWMVGGVFFVASAWVDDVLGEEGDVYWDESIFFLFVWLYFPKTEGAVVIYDFITEPYIGPLIRPVATKMSSTISALYQTAINAIHLYIIWIVFVLLPPGLKRIICIAVGTVYPWVSSVTAAATEDADDDTYWLTYWGCYGILFIIMDILETWLGRIPGFYSIILLITIYLMLPMFQGAEKFFRNVLVPIAGLKEMLMLRDAIRIKKNMLKDLDPERAKKVAKAIAKFYDDDQETPQPNELKRELMNGYQGLAISTMSNLMGKKSDATHTEKTPLV